MKSFAASLIVLLGCLPLACEENTDSLELPYQERLVINGYLQVQPSLEQIIHVSRTLPLNENNSSDKGIVRNAQVFLQFGDTVRQLMYEDDQYHIDGISIFAGRVYTVTVEWNGKRAWANTLAPFPPFIDTVIVGRHNTLDGPVYTAEALVTPHTGEIYMPIWDFASNDTLFTLISQTQGPLTAEDVAEDGCIHFRFVFRLPSAPGPFEHLLFTCYSYDRPYYDYYISRGDPGFSGVPTYSYFTGPVRWNVQGEGIGLFVGQAMNVRVGILP